MSDALLVLNAGSSSLKFQVFDLKGRTLAMVLRGQIEGIPRSPRLVVKDSSGAASTSRPLSEAEGRNHAACMVFLASWLLLYRRDSLLRLRDFLRTRREAFQQWR